MPTASMLALQLSLAVAAVSGVAASAGDQVDVIVVGAGWAGMAAADSLARANVTFLVLEASNRTGGRSHAITFGDSSVKRVVVERGSNWVSGVGGGAGGVAKGMHHIPAENPVHALARQENLAMKRIPGAADGNMSDYDAVYTSAGDPDGDPGRAIRDKANKALDCLNRTAPKVGRDVTVRQGLVKCGWQPTSEVEWAVDWAMSGEDANGEPADTQSLMEFAPDETYEWWGPDDQFVIDQHPRGFARLIDGMVRDTVPTGDPRLLFNAAVTNIAYNCSGVTITTGGGRMFHAKEVISTLPLGVLQRHHKELFSPPLPKKHIEVMDSDGIEMGNLTHVVVQFPSVWWDDSMAKWLSANKGATTSAASGEFSLWHNLNHATLLPGSQTLLTFLGDPQSSKYEGMEDAQVQAALMARLRQQHPRLTLPEPVAFFISRHGYDPLSYGAYSAFKPGWRDKFYNTLTKPLKADGCDPEKKHAARVRFAGEAMCSDLSGYTHGGYQSGKEVAAAYLYEAGKGPDPGDDDALSLCDW